MKDSRVEVEDWLFTVTSSDAERVYLVKDCIGGLTTWVEMRRAGNDRWQVRDRLQHGQYRFRYYTSEGQTLINCGDSGLKAQRITDSSLADAINPNTIAQTA